MNDETMTTPTAEPAATNQTKPAKPKRVAHLNAHHTALLSSVSTMALIGQLRIAASF